MESSAPTSLHSKRNLQSEHNYHGAAADHLRSCLSVTGITSNPKDADEVFEVLEASVCV